MGSRIFWNFDLLGRLGIYFPSTLIHFLPKGKLFDEHLRIFTIVFFNLSHFRVHLYDKESGYKENFLTARYSNVWRDTFYMWKAKYEVILFDIEDFNFLQKKVETSYSSLTWKLKSMEIEILSWHKQAFWNKLLRILRGSLLTPVSFLFALIYMIHKHHTLSCLLAVRCESGV